MQIRKKTHTPSKSKYKQSKLAKTLKNKQHLLSLPVTKMDNKEYLEEGFDPKSLKVSQLRGILNEYQISFPSNAKKSDLIKLFDDQLKPKAAQLLKNYRASVGNSNNSGFVDVAKSSNLSKKMSNEITKVSDEKRKVSKSKRKTRKSSTPIEELEVVDITEESPFSNDNVFQKKSPSSKKRNHEEATEKDSHKKQKGNIFGVESDSDDDLFKDSKKSRVSNAKSDTPIVVKESDNSTKSTPVKTDKSVTSTPAKADKSVTDSVKSPASNSSTKSVRSPASEEVHIPRRKIITPEAEPPKKTSLEDELPKETSLEDEAKDFDSDLNKIKSASTTPKTRNLRKRTPQSTPSSSKATPKTRRQINQDLADQLGITIKGYSPKYKSLTPKPRGTITRKPIIQPIESDDEEVETESDDEENTKRNQVKNKVKSIENLPFKLIFRTITYLILWVSLISIGLFGYWYREQQYLVGYCGHEITQPTIPQTIDTSPILLQIGNYLDENFKPKCIKCPAHARCFENLQIGCYEDFVEYKPWYFDYLPILNRTTKICIPDTKKAEKIEIMIDVALDFLRSKNADKNCGRSLPSDLEAGLEVNELHDLLLSMKAPYITTEEFEELWQRSLIELEKEPEIIVRQVT